MCNSENQEVMQRGMNFRMNPSYSVILMSQRANAPYSDKVHGDGVTIEYEGHDISKAYSKNPKVEDQPEKLSSGKLTQNGFFIKAVNDFKMKGGIPELVKVYEKCFLESGLLKGTLI
ncbi:MAG: restriction endonuclease [Parcubacteria group bacterium Greene0714_7]|nr:MAG: restriction endonuclease [Parcubacteria group bacterium Greene0714_7]